MTEKKLNILNAATELFAQEGFKTTSTSKVASKAGVSEGLIFKHFKNKPGLLDAILEEGEKRFRTLYGDIIFESNPKHVLKRTIEMPFKIPERDYRLWRLQFKLKWELNLSNDAKRESLMIKLEKSFQSLGFDNPKMEAYFLLNALDNISEVILNGSLINKDEFKNFLYKKYNL